MPHLDLQDTRLHYAVHGDGPPVVLIQGVGVAGTAWQPQVDALAPSFTTLVLDNRGVAGSQPCRGPISIEAMAGDVRALLDHLRWPSAHVVGHSMGGVIAQQVALDIPGRIRSLSLLCTFARGRDAARPTPWVLWMTLRTRLGPRASRRRAFLEMLLPRGELARLEADGRTAEVAERFARWIGRDLADQPPVLMKQVRALARHDTSARLGSLKDIPAWVLSAEGDPIAPPRYGAALARALGDVTHHVVPDAAHAVNLHQPAAVDVPLLAFLRRVEAGASGPDR